MGPGKSGEDDRDSMFLPGMEELAEEKRGGTPAGDNGDSRGTGSDNAADANRRTDHRIADMNADANELNLSNAGVKPDLTHTGQGQMPPPEYVEPLWMRRTKLVIFVMACIYLGIILIILPWNEVWTQNGLIHRYPGLREMAMSYFVRGAITGLGFVNVWLGVWEAVHYREQKR